MQHVQMFDSLNTPNELAGKTTCLKNAPRVLTLMWRLFLK